MGRWQSLSAEDRDRLDALTRAMVSKLLPDLAGVRLSRVWKGQCAGTFDFMPHVGRHEGLWYAMGYNFAGVPMGSYLGLKLAQQILGKAEGASVFGTTSAFNDCSFIVGSCNAAEVYYIQVRGPGDGTGWDVTQPYSFKLSNSAAFFPCILVLGGAGPFLPSHGWRPTRIACFRSRFSCYCTKYDSRCIITIIKHKRQANTR